MIYSYMPAKECEQQIEFGEHWFLSEERNLLFRNQYGEIFMLIHRNVFLIVSVIVFIAGIFIGRII